MKNPNGLKKAACSEKPLKMLGALGAVLLLTSTAGAQINSAVPFYGQYHEDFESSTPLLNGYAPNPLFLGRADYHTSSAGKANGWGFGCFMTPHGGAQFAGDNSGLMWMDFDMGPSRFGGYFGSIQPNGPVTAAVRFIGAGGAVLGTDSVYVSNSCSWQWIGWEFTGLEVLRIEIETAPSPGFLMMDDLNMDLPINSGCAISYCMGDGTDGECPCSNYGDPGHGCSTGSNPRGGRLTESVSNGCSFVMGSMNGLVAKDVTPNELGMFIHGKAPNNAGQGVMMADGRLCVGAPAAKLQVTVANSAGLAETTVDLPTSSMALGTYIGDAVYYQFIYRTPAAHSACGGTFNLTNGVHWTWTM